MSTSISTMEAYELLRRFEGRTRTSKNENGDTIIKFQEQMIEYTVVYDRHGFVTLSTNNMVA